MFRIRERVLKFSTGPTYLDVLENFKQAAEDKEK